MQGGKHAANRYLVASHVAGCPESYFSRTRNPLTWIVPSFC